MLCRRIKQGGVIGDIVLEGEVKEGLSEEVTLSSAEWNKGPSPPNIWRKSIPGGGNSQCKGFILLHGRDSSLLPRIVRHVCLITLSPFILLCGFFRYISSFLFYRHLEGSICI